MKAVLWARRLLACGLVAVASTAGAQVDDPAAVKPEEKQKRLDRQVQDSLTWCQLTSDATSEDRFKPQTVLRWGNAPRGQEGEATMVLWIDRGRPEALASIYPWRGNLMLEFVSLSRGGPVVGRDGGRTVWSPLRAGVDFRDIADAPAPADSPANRLKQMKALTARFGSTMTGWKDDDTDREELRLLPRPIYRYEVGEGKSGRPDLVDGAVFAFVQGTDPEVVLLLEAVRGDGLPRWQYGFGRTTNGGVEARLDKAIVWSAPKMVPQDDPSSTMITFGRPLAP